MGLVIKLLGSCGEGGVYDFDTKSVRDGAGGGGSKIKKEAPSLFQYFQLSLLYLLTRCSCELFLSFYGLPLLN